jgi:ribosomal protein L11 methyltransferase
MRCIELSLEIKPEHIDDITHFLEGCGQRDISIENWENDGKEKTTFIKIFLPGKRNSRIEIDHLKNKLMSSYPQSIINLKERILKPEDWFKSIKEQFNIIEIGEKFTIKASWAEEPPDKSRIIIELDPGYAFGTGLHPTTRLCLVQLEKFVRTGMKILDLGTGSGILSIAAAKIGAAPVLALDTNVHAVYAARNNIQTNRVENAIQVKRGTLSIRTQRLFKKSFDLVVANISAQIIAGYASAFHRVLKPGGLLIVSGISSPGLDEVLIRLSLAEFKLKNIHQDGEWYAVVARKS